MQRIYDGTMLERLGPEKCIEDYINTLLVCKLGSIAGDRILHTNDCTGQLLGTTQISLGAQGCTPPTECTKVTQEPCPRLPRYLTMADLERSSSSCSSSSSSSSRAARPKLCPLEFPVPPGLILSAHRVALEQVVRSHLLLVLTAHRSAMMVTFASPT